MGEELNPSFDGRFDFEEHLSLDKCYVATATEIVLEDDDVVTLLWDIPNGAEREAVAWIRSNRVSLSDFSTPFRNFSGTWRGVKVETRAVEAKNVHKVQLVYTIAKGYNEAFNWEFARLYEDKSSPRSDVSTAKTLVVEFPYCNPAFVDSIVNSVDDLQFVNPVIRGETISGTFSKLLATSRVEEDKSRTIVMVLADNQFSLTAFSDYGTIGSGEVYYVWNVPKPSAQAIITAWGAAYTTGASATASYSKEAEVVDLILRKKVYNKDEWSGIITHYDCRYIEYTDYHWGLTRDEAEAVELAEPSQGWTYDLEISNAGDHWSVIVRRRQVRFRDVDVGIVQIDSNSEVEQRQRLGRTTQPDIDMTEEAGKVKSLSVEIKDDCSRDETLNTETGKELQSKRYVVDASGSTELTVDTYQDEGSVEEPVQEDGKRHIVEITPEKYPSKVTASRETFEPSNQTSRSVIVTPEQEVIETLDTEKDTPTADPVETIGHELELIVRPTDVGNEQVIQRDTRFKERIAESNGGTVLELESDIIEDNTTAEAQTGPAPVGKIYRNSSEPIRGGLFRNRKTVVEKTPYDKSSLRVGGNAFRETYLTLKKNQSTEDFARASGKDRSASASIEESGLLDVAETEDLPVQQLFEFDSEVDEYFTKNTTRAYNQDSIPDATVVGERIDGTMNTLEKYDYVKENSNVNQDLLASTLTYIEWGRGQWIESSHSYYTRWFGYAATQDAAEGGYDDAFTYGLSNATRGLAYVKTKSTHTVRYFETEAEAVAYINTDAQPADNTSIEGDYGRVAPGLFRAHKIVSELVIINEIRI